MTLAQFFHLQQSSRPILVGGRAEAVLRKPMRAIMLAGANAEHADRRYYRKLLGGLVALHKHGTKK
jgi:hypothetical protein